MLMMPMMLMLFGVETNDDGGGGYCNDVDGDGDDHNDYNDNGDEDIAAAGVHEVRGRW